MSGAVVAAALRARRRKQHVDHEHIDDYIDDEQASAAAFRTRKLDEIMQSKMDQTTFALDSVRKKAIKHEKQVEGLLAKVEAKMEVSTHYWNLTGMLLFFAVYVTTLFLQRDATAAYSIEASFLNTLVVGLPGSVSSQTSKYITSKNDFFDWLEADIVERVYTDPICGDGTCDSPDEYPGFGRFGCIQDCGRYVSVSTITLTLQPFLNATMSDMDYELQDWELNEFVKQFNLNPVYKFNIWSETMGDYLLAEDAVPTGEPLVVEVPDGKLELELYQTVQLASKVDANSIYGFTYVDPATMPVREASSDFFYGDKAEALSAQSIMLSQISDFCWGNPDTTTEQLLKCLGLPQHDIYFKTMASYGLKGDIKTLKGLAPDVLVNVDFCKVGYQNGTRGLKDSTNKAVAIESQMACSSTSNRRLMKLRQQASTAPPEALHTARKAKHGKKAATEHSAEARSSRHLLQVPAGSVAQYNNCTAHMQCMQTPTDPYLPDGQNAGQFCSKVSGVCDTCSYCQRDAVDAVDGSCPQAQCPGSGGFPECIDANKLLDDWQCPNKYPFEVYKFAAAGSTVQVKPPPKDKIRRMTPFNRIVGAVAVSQRRRQTGVCDKIFNKDVETFAKAVECLSSGYTQTPFGRDPVIMPTASIYNGKLRPEMFYNNSERYNVTVNVSTQGGGSAEIERLSVPQGFFPHTYDTSIRGTKAAAETVKRHENDYFAYFDVRNTRSQAKNMVAYLREGGFIDEFTTEVYVDFVTFNTNLNLFAIVGFNFKWDVGGGIAWDFALQTVFVDIYTGARGQAQLVFEIVSFIFLAINCLLEFRDIIIAIRVMKPLHYFQNPVNVLDWAHLVLMWTGWIMWALYYQRTQNFSMYKEYPVLMDPAASARYFATNSTAEMEYLHFLDNIRDTSSALAQYTAISSVCVLLFILRVLKSFDFQPRMGLVTKTLYTALPDLAHFSFLFFVVFFGYSLVGYLLFGHHFGEMATPGRSLVFLYFQLVAYDPEQFWIEMTHAAPWWAFHLYLWTFLLIVFFILVNILLAILIDAYALVKAETPDDAPGFPEELSNVFSNTLNDWTTPSSQRMTDSKLKETLLSHKDGLPSTDVLRDALMISTAPPEPILLPGGVQIDANDMRKLIKSADDAAMNKRKSSLKAFEAVDEEEGEEKAEETDQEWDGEEEELVNDLVQRFSKQSKVDDAMMEGQTLSILQLEHLKRELAMFRGAQRMHKTVLKIEEQLDRIALEALPPEERTTNEDYAQVTTFIQKKKVRGIIRVTVVEARDLPPMDLLRSVDPYCLVFLTERLGESTTGEITFRTDEKNREKNPVWNADFELPIMRDSTALTVAIYDKDSITRDDLVGCVHVTLDSLENWAQTDEWFPLVNPKMNHKRLQHARLRLKITRLPDVQDTTVRERAALPGIQEGVERTPSNATNDADGGAGVGSVPVPQGFGG